VTPNLAISVALWIDTCQDFVVSAVSVLGPNAILYPTDGGTGLDVTASQGVLSGVQATGGNGAGSAGGTGYAGGRGCSIDSSDVAISNCRFHSGDSGAGTFGTSASGPALTCFSQSTVAMDECTLLPGVPAGYRFIVDHSRVLLANHLGGVSLATINPGGAIEFDGSLTLSSSSLPATQRPQPGLVGPDSVPRGGTIQWTVHGASGQIGASAMSLGTVPSAIPSVFDTMLFTPGHPTAILTGLFTIGATGSTAIPLAVPNLPALVDVHVFLQVAGWINQPRWKASAVAVTRIL
jgi:hypothetical protein